MFGLGKVGKGWKVWRAWGKFDTVTKELWSLKEAGVLKSKTVWGGIFLALIPLAKAILPMINLPPETITNIISAMTAIGAILVPVGIKHAIEKAKKG